MLIIAKKSGQLGNRLILFAHVLACAIEKKRTVINTSFFEYTSYFKKTSKNLLSIYPDNKIHLTSNLLLAQFIYIFIRILATFLAKIKLPYIKSLQLNEATEDEIILDSSSFVSLINTNKIIFLQGWRIRDNSNIIKHADKIRSYFTPIDTHQKNILKLITPIRNSCDVLIGLHIRQGDYEQWQGGKYFYTTEQYFCIIKKIKQLFPNKKLAFLICSNVQQDKYIYSTFNSEFNIYFANNHIIEDMYSLAKCDYITGPPSTYTMWASFYGKVPLYMIYEPNAPISLNNFNIITSF